jgi:hypothetical protein
LIRGCVERVQNICARVRPQISIEVASRLRSISISYFMAFSSSGYRVESGPAWQD